MPDLRVEAQVFARLGDHLGGVLADGLNKHGNILKPEGITRTAIYDQILLPQAGFHGSFGTGSIHFRHFNRQITIAEKIGLPHVRDELDIDLHLDEATLKGAIWFNNNFPNSQYIRNPRARFYFDGEGNYGVTARLFHALPGIDNRQVVFDRAGINGREIWVKSDFEETQIEIIGAAYMRLISTAQEAVAKHTTQKDET